MCLLRCLPTCRRQSCSICPKAAAVSSTFAGNITFSHVLNLSSVVGGTVNFTGALDDGGALSLGLNIVGGGTIVLSGSNLYTGVTTVHSGTLALAPGASEQGTPIVTVGQNPGDVATVQLGSSSYLGLAGWNAGNPAASTDQPVMIAQNAGSTGTIYFNASPVGGI